MIVWALTDDRAGNNSQTIGLAQTLSNKYKIKEVSYSKLANLPNFFPFCSINNNLKQELITKKSPDIIISCGRKLAKIAILLKKYHKNSLLVQIMHPNINFNKFDIIILPNHDKNYKNLNIIRSFGSLTKINYDKLESEYIKFNYLLKNIKAPKIALLLGGSSKKHKFTLKVAIKLRKICQDVVNNMKGNLMILDSRRTDGFILEEFKNNLECNCKFFNYDQKKPNPYLAILKDSDYIIVTGDSISMCSEIASLDKPIYIFSENIFCSSKHLKFHQDLFNNNYAKKLDNNIKILDNYSRNILDETNRIAKLIKLQYEEKINHN
tara:strand:+ start:8051 stop:9019 length:969 start_codon:yes stop_codon:yes gene_type:complete